MLSEATRSIHGAWRIALMDRNALSYFNVTIDGFWRSFVALGVVAHGAVLAALGLRKSAMAFRHGAMHQLTAGRILADSYHCSRYNTNTGRLTAAMFDAVFAAVVEELPPP